MSEFLGVVRLTGRNGTYLLAYDDCVVQAFTGIAAAVGNIKDGRADEAGKDLLASLTGTNRRFLTLQPEEVLEESSKNRRVMTADVQSVVLSKGRWPTVGLRRLVVTLHGGKTVEWTWTGKGATRPLNSDDEAVELLTRTYAHLLEVRLPT